MLVLVPVPRNHETLMLRLPRPRRYTRLTVHMIDVEDKAWFLTTTKFRLPEYALIGSIGAVTSTIIPGAIVTFGTTVGAIMSCILLLYVALFSLWGVRDLMTTHKYLKDKFAAEYPATD